ncbi:hypothetical protein LSH36_315g03172 [Paralvinella palmiformis]|uniref:Neurotransmitter-gated ion-channel ligand-binding domain-containing protein n=1 Tax=Paralvinella palmiformis TaxID=53620 RepID=A0AAD9JGU9_9ANNE|nr:hypothetical protein LSH36_315g03172 [Paralvinella palmiformis]
MEGNLNQYMSLQGEHDAEERRSDRTLEESYMLEDDGLYDQEFPVSDNDPKDWNKSSGRRPSAMAKLAPETQNLCQAIQSLEKTINAHCQLLNRKSRGTIKSDSSRMGQALNSGSSVVRGDKEPSGYGVSLYPTTTSTTSVDDHDHRDNDEQKEEEEDSTPNDVDDNYDDDDDDDSSCARGGSSGGFSGDGIKYVKYVITYIRVVFLKIGEIDTLKETFTADTYVQAKWREPALDGLMDLNINDIQWDKYWNPKLFVENSLGDPKETIWQTVTYNSKGEATVYERRRVKGVFLENLELDEFPFDTQIESIDLKENKTEHGHRIDGKQIPTSGRGKRERRLIKSGL